MPAECPGCPPARRPRSLWVALGGGLLAVLVPKCPLCLAASLSFLGAATGVVADGMVWLRPLGVALAVVGVVGVALALVRRRS